MCVDVHSKVYRCVLIQLRGRTAQLHIKTGRWRQVPIRDLWICRECSSGDVEDVRHWLLQCSAWEASRFPQKMVEHYIDFPILNNEAKVAIIFELKLLVNILLSSKCLVSR